MVGLGYCESRVCDPEFQFKSCSFTSLSQSSSFSLLCYLHEYQLQDSRPSEADNQQKRVLENKIFSVRPRSGSLTPGENAEILFSHRHVAIGDDQLPVSVRVGERTFTLLLKGSTLSASGGHLFFSSKEHELASVDLGCLSAPVQHYTLYNIGEEDLVARVSIKPFRPELDEIKLGLSIVTVPARGTALIPLRFQPLISGMHDFVMIVEQEGCEAVNVKLLAMALDPYWTGPRAPPIPSSMFYPHATMPGQLLVLSSEVVDFGDLALYGVARRLVGLRNLTESVISFRWTLGSFGTALSVRPSSGILQPGETRLCQFTMRGIDGTRVYSNMDVLLESQNEDQRAIYAAALDAAIKDRERAAAGFILTDRGRTGKGRAGAYDVKGPSGSARVAMLSSTEFPSKLLASGFNPSITASPSAAMQEDTTLSSTTAGATLLNTSLRKGKHSLPVTDLDLRTSKYQVCVVPVLDIASSLGGGGGTYVS